ncbi:MAG TPA: hypothetical protein VFF52_25270 [Isosphaeraceae bacterium]|nr:hypothetical protein [Isosphaeraceae bacterium]
MTEILAQIVAWLNGAANALGRLLLAPAGHLPGWLSATVVAAVTGVLLLIMFKYTSNQRAIQRVRDDINAHLLALKLFKDSTSVSLRAQGRILWGALRLFVLALVPMLVMVVPVCLILGQLALWYQARPLRVGEDAVVTVKLNGSAGSSWPDVRLRPTGAVEVATGPVRVLSKQEVCWDVKAVESGDHRLDFQVGQETFAKELAIGDGFMRVSRLRPGWQWLDILLNPAEPPFGPGSPVQSIEVDYPPRSSWTSGTDVWIIYWFAVSMISALCFRRLLNVNV